MDPSAGSLPSGVAPRPPRLPGVTFAPAPPEPFRVLPRMDVPVFVGFAARGPVDEPVVVEDIDAFTATFGGEMTIVWDGDTGQPVRGQLRGAVRAFFRNGGRRCWIVRIADPEPPEDQPDELLALDAALFLDEDLADVPAGRLLADGDFIRFQRDQPRRLRGIHAALEIEEATLLVVPDAALPTWNRHLPDVVPSVAPTPRPPRDARTFEVCESGPPAAPEPTVQRSADDPASFTVAWEAVEGATGYEVESGREPGARRGPSIVATTAVTHGVSEARPGSYRFRVRALGPRGTGAWSAPVRVVVDPTPRYRLDEAPDRTTAVAVHAAMLRLCAARGDLFAILSLPEAVDADEVLRHVADVRAAVIGIAVDPAVAPARDADPRNVLSFGAIYHPWLLVADAIDAVHASPAATAGPDGDVSRRAGPSPAVARPPDGSVAGVFADRAARRGAWIAPGNVALRDVVGLARSLRDDEVAMLHEAQVDVVRQTPSGFRVLATHTLALDPTLRPINVRRLLALLHRLALLHGVDYVFEPNDNAFRRRIQRGFEVLLAGLFERGAFAGRRAADSFRVVVGDPPNTRQSLDAGRLIVELKVAPSTPLEFLTVRLVRSGERFAVEVA